MSIKATNRSDSSTLKSYRVGNDVCAMLDVLKLAFGISRTKVVEAAVRELEAQWRAGEVERIDVQVNHRLVVVRKERQEE